MPIVVQHQPSPGAVGLAAYTSGLGQANERKRKEQLSQLQQMYGQRFQLGMNQLRYGQEQQLAQDRFLQQKQWQDARDERDFGQKQQLANAEARARGEPLPFPGQGQGQLEGSMQGGILPGGRQAFEGPDTTVAPFDDPNAAAGGGYVGKTPHQQREELAKQQRQAEAEAKIRAGIAKGDYVLPGNLEKQIAANDAALAELELDPQWTEGDRDKKRPALEAERQRLDALKVRLAKPVPKQTPEDAWKANVRYADSTTGEIFTTPSTGRVPVQWNDKTRKHEPIKLKEAEVETPSEGHRIAKEEKLRTEQRAEAIALQNSIDTAEWDIEQSRLSLNEAETKDGKSKYTPEQIEAKLAGLTARRDALLKRQAKAQETGTPVQPTSPQGVPETPQPGMAKIDWSKVTPLPQSQGAPQPGPAPAPNVPPKPLGPEGIIPVEDTQPQMATTEPNIAVLQSRADFDALPKGTRYRLPDGREGVK